MIKQREHLNRWAKSLLICTLFLLGLAGGWLVAPAPARALTNCDAAAAPCSEDSNLDICTQCHSIQIHAGNRDGTDRYITKSASVNRHVLDPLSNQSSWPTVVSGMVSKGAGGGSCDQACVDKLSAYLNTNYCTTCTGPIMSPATVSGIDATVATVGWATEALATSCVQYGTTNPPTGNTCTAGDPNYDANNATPTASHSVALANLNPATKYYVIHQSVANGQTSTYTLAKAFTTLDSGTQTTTGGPGAIISLAVGDYNGDQKLDLAAGASVLNTVVSYLGNGLGGFTEGQTLANVGVKPLSITTGGVKGDFNGDNVADLAVGNFGEVANGVLSNANIAIFLGTGAATPVPNPNAAFGSTPVSTIPLTDSPTAVAPGDFDGDGKLDLAVATVSLDASTGRILIFKGDGTGQFTGPITTIPVKIKPPTVTITAITDSACLALSPSVTVTGTKLTDSAEYFLDDATAMTIKSFAEDGTSVVLKIPAGTTAGSHTITAHLGTDSATGPFTVTPRPVTITGLSLASPVYGITSDRAIKITGTGFVLGATITIGSLTGTTVSGTIATATTPFVFQSSTVLYFWYPGTSLSPGGYDAVVTNTDTCAGSATTAFTVQAPQPTISSVASPRTYGVSTSGPITITGTNFVEGATITVGGLTGTTVASTGAATATTPFVYYSSTLLYFWWPNTSISPAAYTVQVTDPAAAGGLSGTLASAFTVVAPQPTVTSTPISKTYGVTASGLISITGTNFVEGATITVGGLTGTTVYTGTVATATTPFVYYSSTLLYFWWPNTSLMPAAYTELVTNPAIAGGLSASKASAFTVVAPQPTVTSTPISKTYGITASGSIAITGTNFVEGATITVGGLTGTTVKTGTAAATATTPFVYYSSTSVYFWWPNTSLMPAAYTELVTNPVEAGGLSASKASAFTVVAPLPTVTSLSPTPVTYGVTASKSIAIAGTNFVLGATITIQGAGGTLSGVTVSGSAATSTTPFVYTNSSSVKFWWGNTSLPAGSYDVIVTEPAEGGGLSATKVGGFVVN